METKFSKGVWGYFYNEEGYYTVVCDGKTIDTKTIIAIVGMDETYNEVQDRIEAEANAKLISAAPNLIEALNDLLIEVSPSANFDLRTSKNPAIQKALVAIKKATEGT